MDIDFTDYNLDELFQALEGVDDFDYPDNAMEIYKLVLSKLNLNHNDVDSRSLGYESGALAESAFMGIISFPFESLAKDQHILSANMRDKINRLNSRLNNENI